jgi:hypothetical protein
LNEIWNCDCSMFEIPNVTRVAGFYRMIQSLVRNKHLYEYALTYQSIQLRELSDYSLDEDEWTAVSQV